MRSIIFCGFCIVLFIAIVLRVNNVSGVPPSLSLDEVSIGYNAYSILKTGADEYGTTLPILLRAYDDWRPAAYAYLVAASIPFFGLTPYSIRLPAVLLSILTVILAYFLAYHVSKQSTGNEKTAAWTGIITALLISISPWHIYLSRLGHEANLGHAATVLFVYGLVRWAEKKQSGWLWVSMIGSIVALYGYQSQKLIIPLICLIFLWVYFSDIRTNLRQYLTVGVVGLILITPLVMTTLSPSSLIRLRATSAFDSNSTEFQRRADLYAKALGEGNMLNIFRYNLRIFQGTIFINNYLSHFSPRWLFAGGNFEAHKVPGMGLLFPWELILLLCGSFVVVAFAGQKKLLFFIFLIIAIAPIPAAITTQAPHAMRSYTMIPYFQIISGIGAYKIVESLKFITYKIVFITLCTMVIVVSIAWLWRQYYTVFPFTQSDSFQYAYTQSISWVIEHQNEYERIVISNRGDLYQSYMFYLFYSRFDPAQYKRIGGTRSGGYNEIHTIGKYEFRPFLWEEEIRGKKTLYVGSSNDFPPGEEGIKVFHSRDGSSSVKAIQKL